MRQRVSGRCNDGGETLSSCKERTHISSLAKFISAEGFFEAVQDLTSVLGYHDWLPGLLDLRAGDILGHDMRAGL